MSLDQLHPRAFWFLRHGETDWNARDLAQGNVDVPLNETGRAQARSAALLLQNRGISVIFSSPLTRARDTAETVARELGLTVQVDPALREVAYGVQEGQPMTEWLVAWIQGTLTPDGAESFAELKARAVMAVNRCTSHAPPVLIVAHGAFFRALRAVMGHEPNVRTRNAVPVWCDPPSAASAPWDVSYAE